MLVKTSGWRLLAEMDSSVVMGAAEKDFPRGYLLLRSSQICYFAMLFIATYAYFTGAKAIFCMQLLVQQVVASSLDAQHGFNNRNAIFVALGQNAALLHARQCGIGLAPPTHLFLARS